MTPKLAGGADDASAPPPGVAHHRPSEVLAGLGEQRSPCRLKTPPTIVCSTSSQISTYLGHGMAATVPRKTDGTPSAPTEP